MRAVVCNQYGPPEQLVVTEMPDPEPQEGQLLVKVAASAVTFPDTLMLENKYQVSAQPPYIPGGEVAGEVVGLGDGVEGWELGDRVIGGFGTVGGYAELAVVPADRARKLPDSVAYDVVVGTNYSYGTTLYALKYRGDLQPGDTLLVTGASGALGLSAIELGKLLGARVIAAASTDEKLEVCRRHGADETINYTTEDLKVRAKELTGGTGVDVVYDGVGGDHAEQALRAIGWKGRFLVIGFTAGIPSIPLNLALLKSCQIVGVFYGAMLFHEPELAATISDDLVAMIASGDLEPYVAGHYPLDGAAEALRSLMDRQAVGKLVIAP